MQRGNKRLKRNDGQSKETSQASKWMDNEDDFLLQQKKEGASIRVRENRSRPIDALSVNLRLIEKKDDTLEDYEDEEREMAVAMPHKLIAEMNDIEGVKNTVAEIEEYMKLEKTKASINFWTTMKKLCEVRKSELQAVDDDPEKRVVQPVSADIDNILKDKSLQELNDLEEKIHLMLRDDNRTIDRDFWTQLLKELENRKARVQLVDIEKDALASRVSRLERIQRTIALREKMKVSNKVEHGVKFESIPYDPKMDVQDAKDGVPTETLTWDEFAQKLSAAKEDLISRGFIAKDSPRTTSFVPEKPRNIENKYTHRLLPLEADEEMFSDEDKAFISQKNGIKPRYSNRVMLGFEWTRYNQAHYNSDNPPPKVVQGYRFNIFYPELQNDSPTYKVIKKDPNSDTCLIIFKAPHTYRDIAFRIVNHPWDQSSYRRAGFVSKFENGVLQLHFRFKRIHYRK